jgi:hypothetical protein
MASACHYHPNAKGTAKCAECGQFICDKCRLRGKDGSCASCFDIQARGGAEDGRARRVMCTNHPGTPTDTKCKQCRKAHCVACLNTAGACFRCAMSTTKSPTGPLKARGTTKLEPPKQPNKLMAFGPKKLGGAVAGIAIVCVLGYGLTHRSSDEPGLPAFMGASGVSIVGPMRGVPLRGPQIIKLDVRSKEAVEKVEINIDGKYWDLWDKGRTPPYESEWPTGIFKNGNHEVVAIVSYRGGRRKAADKQHFQTKNR